MKVYNIRKMFIEKINNLLSNIYVKLGGFDDLFINYKSDYTNKAKVHIKEDYKNNIEKDISFGSTQIGIHRDDFVFFANNKDIKNFASEGQQKNAIIAFKLSEIELFYRQKKEYPILILDDLFSELDLKKIENILNFISNEIQTFITTTDLKKIKKKYLKNSKIFKITEKGIEEDIYE